MPAVGVSGSSYRAVQWRVCVCGGVMFPVDHSVLPGGADAPSDCAFANAWSGLLLNYVRRGLGDRAAG